MTSALLWILGMLLGAGGMVCLIASSRIDAREEGVAAGKKEVINATSHNYNKIAVQRDFDRVRLTFSSPDIADNVWTLDKGAADNLLRQLKDAMEVKP